jgi:EAL domain-containing protein (putative c-di-GMP-specific phosphodiesterase class I)
MGDEDPASSAIASAIVTLARSLGLSVCAEGVETEAQLRAVRDLGCHVIQGFLFSPPVPADRFPTAPFPVADPTR